jgi:hypothetical protein
MPFCSPSLSLAWDPVAGADGYMLYNGTNASDAGTNTTMAVANLAPGSTNVFTATAYVADDSLAYLTSYLPETNIVQSPPSNPVIFVAPGYLGISPGVVLFSVGPGEIYSLQTSSDLLSWSNALSSFSTTNALMRYSFSPTNSAQFFRLFSFYPQPQ